MRRLLRSSNNGSAGGPSGWAGNMLSSLVESALCRAGIITLLRLSIIMSFVSISAAGYSQCDSCSILRAHASIWC